MKDFILLIFVFVCSIANGQTNDSLYINLKYRPSDPDLLFYFSTRNIDLYKIKISNNLEYNFRFTLVSNDIWNGEILKRDTIFSWKDNKSFV